MNRHILQYQPAHKRLIVLGVTSKWAFAAGTVILALKRHNPNLKSDLLIFHDGQLKPQDKQIFTDLGCHLSHGSYRSNSLAENILKIFSPLALSKFLCFELLEFYEKIIWLDSDIIIQDQIDELWDYGPFSLAKEDPEFYEMRKPKTAKINFSAPSIPSLPEFDLNAPNYNSGVIVFGQRLSNPKYYLDQCYRYLDATKEINRFADQGAFNFLAQILKQEKSSEWQELPIKFNCHPRNQASLYAPIVHAFGAYKLWNDGLTQACFPEWQRDYLRWIKLGGSGWMGEVENQNYLNQGCFALLTKFFDTISQSQTLIDKLTKQIQIEKLTNAKLTQIIEKFKDL
ncbi:MAG: glycosyl transferase family 8 [Desulfovibrionaceae bacterium]|nr:glycosyl transferase family 8 [Desulfovibrionaceae bacterium]